MEYRNETKRRKYYSNIDSMKIKYFLLEFRNVDFLYYDATKSSNTAKISAHYPHGGRQTGLSDSNYLNSSSYYNGHDATTQKRTRYAIHSTVEFEIQADSRSKTNKYVEILDFRGEVVQQLQQASQRAPSPVSRPGSSDGSTTVSATSSPGIDQQEQEELNAIYQVNFVIFYSLFFVYKKLIKGSNDIQ